MSDAPRRKRPQTGSKAAGANGAQRKAKGRGPSREIPWVRIVMWSLAAVAAVLGLIEFQGRQAYESSWSALDAAVAAATDDKPLLAADVATLLPGKSPQAQVNLPGEIPFGEATRYEDYVWSSLNPANRRVARVYYNKLNEVVKIDRGG